MDKWLKEWIDRKNPSDSSGKQQSYTTQPQYLYFCEWPRIHTLFFINPEAIEYDVNAYVQHFAIITFILVYYEITFWPDGMI